MLVGILIKDEISVANLVIDSSSILIKLFFCDI